MPLPPGMQHIVEQREKLETGLLAALIPRAIRSLKWEQKAAEATQSAAHRTLFRDQGIHMPETDETVNVDSPQTHNHYYYNEKPAGAVGNSGSKLGALAKAGVAAALIGSGAGATIGIPLGLSALKDLLKPQPAATAPAAPDSTGGESVTSPRYLLELGKPE